jgi:hypothetical protein
MLKPETILISLLIMGILIFSLSCEKKDTDNLLLLVSSDFEGGSAQGWEPNFPENWRIVNKDGSMVYELIAPGKRGKFSGPTSYSVLADHDVTSFEFTGRLKSDVEIDVADRDVCLFIHYQDPAHFYYIHFSDKSDRLHNIIGLVNGADRVKINNEPAGESDARLVDMDWHDFKITFDASTGEIQVFFDKMQTPILTAHDSALGHGRIGVGCYDDKASFDDIKLRGKKTEK